MIISRRTFLLITGLVLLAVVIAVLWWLVRPPKTDRQQIVDLLSRTERAAEHKDLGGVMRVVSEDYSDGIYSKRELRRAVVAGFRQVKTIRITLALHKLEITGEHARAELDVDVWIDSNSPRPTMDMSMWVELSEESGEWLVTSAGGDWPEAAEQPLPHE